MFRFGNTKPEQTCGFGNTKPEQTCGFGNLSKTRSNFDSFYQGGSADSSHLTSDVGKCLTNAYNGETRFTNVSRFGNVKPEQTCGFGKKKGKIKFKNIIKNLIKEIKFLKSKK